MEFVIAAFYKFVSFPDFATRQEPFLAKCEEQKIKGSILLASEGINGTIAGSETAIANILAFFRTDPRFADLTYQESRCDFMPFKKLKVRLKKEIVTIGIPQINPLEQVGTYVTPQEWNELILDPDVMVIDTRNDYEFELGTFSGAINPETESFREFPQYVDSELENCDRQTKIAMFCTGGIRCEKATSLLRSKGFTQVYHLQGGILRYLAEIPEAKSLWQGDCFVFDQRVTVTHNLRLGNNRQWVY